MNLRRKLAALLRKEKLDAEMAEEMRAHLELQTRDNLARGMSPDEARYAAQRAFGGVEQVKERCRDERTRGVVWLELLVQDLRYGARSLRKSPGFTAVSVLTFSVGIGAALAIASVVDAFYLRPLPIPNADRVMTIWQSNVATGARGEDASPGNAIDWCERARSFDSIALAEPWTLRFRSSPDSHPELLPAAKVSAGFFNVLGSPMLHGRGFLPAEHPRDAARSVVLSHAFWSERFGGNASIVGEPVRLDEGQPYIVVGVLRPGFELRLFGRRNRLPEPLLWLPKAPLEDIERTLRGTGYWNVIGRLAPGVSRENAQAELDAISAQLARENPRTNKAVGAEVVPLREHLLGRLRQLLPLLAGAAVILLIVACANVANLLLARGAGRDREFAVRQALGARRGRLIRQMFVESVLLAAAGGAMALLFARWALDLIAKLRPLDVARVDYIAIDARAALIACGVSMAAAILAGLTPALQLSRPTAVAALKDTRGSSRGRMRNAIIILEVSGALVLAVGAGLLVRSFVLIQRVDPGFKPDNVAVLEVFLFERFNTAQKRSAFVEQAVERMRTVPGAVAVGAVSSMPFGNSRLNRPVTLEIAGRPAAPRDDMQVPATTVAGDYFQAMGVPLVRGRLFNAGDTSASPKVVLVSRATAQKFWPGADPVGSRVKFRFDNLSFDAEVVGVVGEVRHDALDLPPRAELFMPHAQVGFGAMAFVVRVQPGAVPPSQALKEQIWALDALQPVNAANSLEGLISRTLIGRRFNLLLLGGFAIVTLLLASAGVYGVMNFSTSQRTREFGVRLALGATSRDVLLLVLRDGAKVITIGIVVGLLGAVVLSRSVESMLFGLSATDPVTFAAIPLLLASVALAACWLPAWRATKVDPMVALRAE